MLTPSPPATGVGARGNPSAGWLIFRRVGFRKDAEPSLPARPLPLALINIQKLI